MQPCTDLSVREHEALPRLSGGEKDSGHGHAFPDSNCREKGGTIALWSNPFSILRTG